MTCAAFTKLLVLVLVAFIMCLPEFFTSHRERTIDFSCFLLRPCLENMSQWDNISQTQQVRDRGGGPYGGCANISTHGSACVVTANRTHSSIDWFLCETEADLRSLRRSTSWSAEDTQRVFCCCVDCAVQNNTAGITDTFSIRSYCILSTQGTNSTQLNTSWQR
ncbi:hypothetical protein AAFF_G00180160 [Aldrovandia affinis]|uniref:Uncharacterized protein n=1 Tax=Aldrovandia affinis TaxID=143900 RepID=A0AAD7WVE7_9TELE|nr:hypothetical protein AAFF_G00180160 [Aldrovandia affinis]